MKKILLILFCFLFLISMVSAFLGTYEQGANVSVRGNLNASSVNVSIYFPDSSIAVDNQPMTQLKEEIWNYSFSSTNILGEYIYDYCDQNGKNCRENNFEVTPSGRGSPTDGEGIIFLGSLIAMLVVGGIFLYLASSFKESPTMRLIFTSLTAIICIIVVLYSTVSLMEVFWGFDKIISSYSTFQWVFLFIVFITFIAVLIAIIFKALDSMRIKRGLKEHE